MFLAFLFLPPDFIYLLFFYSIISSNFLSSLQLQTYHPLSYTTNSYKSLLPTFPSTFLCNVGYLNILSMNVIITPYRTFYKLLLLLYITHSLRCYLLYYSLSLKFSFSSFFVVHYSFIYYAHYHSISLFFFSFFMYLTCPRCSSRHPSPNFMYYLSFTFIFTEDPTFTKCCLDLYCFLWDIYRHLYILFLASNI